MMQKVGRIINQGSHMIFIRNLTIAAAVGLALVVSAPGGAVAQDKSLAVQLVDEFNALFGEHPGFRANHAKGAMFEGTFTPSRKAASLSSAAHLQKAPSKITVRFSNASGLPEVPDDNPAGKPRGIAIRFYLPDGSDTDLIGISLKGFPVANGEDFLAFLKAVGASGPDAPKPTPLQTFLASHPATLKIVSLPQPTPVSYATLPYYGINAFKFTNAAGKVQVGRYQIVPVGKPAYVSDAAAAKRPPDILADNVRKSLAKGPVRFKLLLQLAGPGDATNDATQIWPDDRPKIELGVITIAKAVPDSLAAEKKVGFLPTNLTPGIAMSDDPLIALRSEAYAESFRRRSQ
jgi:catalase